MTVANLRGRPAPGWAALPPLAALLILATGVLPAGAERLAVLALVIGLGVPHGALDGEVARPLLRPRWGRWWFGAFAVPYLATAGAVLLAWRLAPEATLAGFLATSVWHFGSEDAPGRAWEALVRGGLPIAAPTLLQPHATAEVLGVVAGVPLDGPPAWLLAAAWTWAVAVLAWVALGRPRRAVLLEGAALLLAFAVLAPLTAFALYFVALHAPRHMRELASDRARAPRVSGMGSAALRSLPVLGLTLCLGALLWPLYDGKPPDRLLALTLQGLAALTLPHMALDLLASRSASQDPKPAGVP